MSLQVPDEVASTIEELTQPLALEQLSRGLLALGGFVFAASVFGYCGASKESRFLLSLVRDGYKMHLSEFRTYPMYFKTFLGPLILFGKFLSNEWCQNDKMEVDLVLSRESARG